MSASKQIAALRVQMERIEAKIEELKPLAAAEPVEFDGASVTVGQRVVVEVTKDKEKSEVEATVLAIKKNEPGVKGPGTLIKVQTGEGFDIDTRVVYPAQVLRLAA